MIRLTEPVYTYEQTLNLCLQGITGNADLHHRITDAIALFLSYRDNYQHLANDGRLFTVAPLDGDDNDPEVIAGIKKSELIKLYERYFREGGKPSRDIYDSIILAAQEKCPYCGGIGRPRNLDHYLPKANYPQYSILPWNLVPACRDCNMEDKSVAFATTAEDQIIQPYFDNSKFFVEQWVQAKYTPRTSHNPGVVEYQVVAPNGWNHEDQQRCQKHFDEFNLAVRYSIQAASEIGYVEDDWFDAHEERSDKNLFIDNCQKIIDRSPFLNHWKRLMYQALIAVV